MKKCPECRAVAPEEAFFCDCGYHFSFEEDSKPAPQVKEEPARNPKWDRVLFVIAALYLVIAFVRRLFPVAEIPRQSESVLRIVFELALAVGLVGLGLRILKTVPRGAPGRGTWIALLVAGLVSLLGIFGIHLTGGQRVESLRSAQSRSVLDDPSTEALGAEIQKITSEMNALVASSEKAQEELDNTRWERTAQATPNQLRSLSREDLREYLSKQRALLDSIDRILQYVAESGFEEKFTRLLSLAKSQGVTSERQRPDMPSWRVLRQLHGAAYELLKIVDENWEEWRLLASSQPAAELKPWQKEIARLAGEVTSAQKQLEQLPEPSSANATSPAR